MPGFVIDGETVSPPGPITILNYEQEAEPKFRSRRRRRKLTHLVLHETAGRTARQCKQTLLKKGYGVHLILARNGIISCHGDLATETMVHANQLNRTSIGIEIVNPYAPKIAGSLNFSTAPAEWWTWCPDKKDRRYVLPTEKQLYTLEKIVPWLCETLEIPYEFPTMYLNRRRRKIKGWRTPPLGWRARPKAGIVAHQDFAKHADGRFLLEYLAKQK